MELFTIGHSTHSLERFLELLAVYGITAVADVRSSPYSRYNPQFNRETLQKELKRKGLQYVFLGRELGPRSDDPACYIEGKVQYNLLAGTDLFRKGLERLKKGMESFRIALMCAEKDPVTCHRAILICRHLRGNGLKISHILEDGSLEDNEDSIKRLMKLLKIQDTHLFKAREEIIQDAYDMQSERIAYGPEQDRENGLQNDVR